jgi:hypothetical protein
VRPPVQVIDFIEDERIVHQFTEHQARLAMFRAIEKHGPAHVTAEPATERSLVCGKMWDELENNTVVVGILLLQRNPSMFEDVPFCDGCLRGLPQR